MDAVKRAGITNISIVTQPLESAAQVAEMQTSHTIRAHSIDVRRDPFGGGIAGSFVLHGAVIALLVGWAYSHHSGQNWGDATATARSRPPWSTSIPLPPKRRRRSKTSSPPRRPAPRPSPPSPRPKKLPSPTPSPSRSSRQAGQARGETAPRRPPPHPQPTKPDPTKAPSGEAPGIQLAMSSTADPRRHLQHRHHRTQTSATASPTTCSRSSRRWPRSGTPACSMRRPPDIASTSPSRSSATARRPTSRSRSAAATQRSTRPQSTRSGTSIPFGPLPDAYTGSHINVTYYFDPPPTVITHRQPNLQPERLP